MTNKELVDQFFDWSNQSGQVFGDFTINGVEYSSDIDIDQSYDHNGKAYDVDVHTIYTNTGEDGTWKLIYRNVEEA